MKINHNLSQLEGKKIICHPGGLSAGDSRSCSCLIKQGKTSLFNERKKREIPDQVRDDNSIVFPESFCRGSVVTEQQTSDNDFRRKIARGFTLIELLVVVLIIGILASVALPQYQKAVAKSRLVAKFNMMRHLAMEEEAYFLENNTYARSYAELGVKNPSDDEWDFTLDMTLPNILLKNKKDSQAYLRFFLQNYSTESSLKNSYKGKWLCLAEKNNELQTSICQSISGKSEKKQYPFRSNYWEFPLN